MPTKPIRRQTADSMFETARRWSIPVYIQRAAKAAGCPAFRNHRVHGEELLTWLAARPEVTRAADAARQLMRDMGALQCEKLRVQIDLAKMRLGIDNGSLIPRVEAEERWAAAAAIVQEEAQVFLSRTEFAAFIQAIRARIQTIIAADETSV